MAAPRDQGNNWGKSTARSTPPHPNNSGGDALRYGIKELEANLADTKTGKPDRTGQSEK
jgi:hypothetical protein